MKNFNKAIGYYVPYLSTIGICMSSMKVINYFPGILGPYILPLLLSILSSIVNYKSIEVVLLLKLIFNFIYFSLESPAK